MTIQVSTILKIGLIGIINRDNNTNYNVSDIETIRFTKNGVTIFTNDDKWFLLKCDILENIEHNNNN